MTRGNRPPDIDLLHLDLGFPASGTVSNELTLFINHPVWYFVIAAGMDKDRGKRHLFRNSQHHAELAKPVPGPK